MNVSVVAFIGVKKKMPYRQEAKKRKNNLKGIEKDLSIKEIAVNYGVPKKKYVKRSTYCKLSKTFFGNLEKKTSPFFENNGEVNCNMS